MSKNIGLKLNAKKAENTSDAEKQYPRIFISTGASGGHIFPGLAIADALRKKGMLCTFIGSGKQFTATVKEQGFDFINLPASPVNVSGVRRKAYALQNLGRAYVMAFRILRKNKPVAVLGLGSYASVAAVMAARVLGIPTILHEQNAKPGRANLLLAPFVRRVMLAFDAAKMHFKDAEKRKHKYTTVGNPVRKEVLELRGVDREDDGKLHVLVFGGSQGSRILSERVPAAVGELPKDVLDKLVVTQQARPEDVVEVKKAYEDMGLRAEVSPFFDNLPELMHKAHVVIGRSGTGSISELAVLNRASILVPLRLADGHQKDNAQILVKAGAAIMIEEHNLTTQELSRELKGLLTRPTKREMFEQNAALVAKPQAAQDAADEIIKLAGLQHIKNTLDTDTEVAKGPIKPKPQTAEEIAAERLAEDDLGPGSVKD